MKIFWIVRQDLSCYVFFIRVIKFLDTRDLPYSQKRIFFTINQKYKVKWVCITLIDCFEEKQH